MKEKGLKDLKAEMFSDLLTWMKNNDIRDTFDETVWGFMVLSEIRDQYREWVKGAEAVNGFVRSISVADLRKLADDKEAQEKAQVEKKLEVIEK